MIPQIIHFCWFGGKTLPKSVVRCVDSWKRFFPNYEIREWNDSTFDVSNIPYTAKSYERGKYAFISDYVRCMALYNYGGVYFDTDVEVIRPFDDILDNGPFLGIEKNRQQITVSPGLGMGAVPGMSFYKEILDIYEGLDGDDDEIVRPYLVNTTTAILLRDGFVKEDRVQVVDGITIYPNDFFNPFDDYTGRLFLTENTHSIHYYDRTWMPARQSMRIPLSRLYHRLKNRLR